MKSIAAIHRKFLKRLKKSLEIFLDKFLKKFKEESTREPLKVSLKKFLNESSVQFFGGFGLLHLGNPND